MWEVINQVQRQKTITQRNVTTRNCDEVIKKTENQLQDQSLNIKRQDSNSP